jgi:hypothetical protein
LKRIKLNTAVPKKEILVQENDIPDKKQEDAKSDLELSEISENSIMMSEGLES